jgi:hypothetical protein
MTLRSSAARGFAYRDRAVLVWRGTSDAGVGHVQLRRLHP